MNNNSIKIKKMDLKIKRESFFSTKIEKLLSSLNINRYRNLIR